jgi:phosphoribosylaminoimidazole-succinocarboxamide synthase
MANGVVVQTDFPELTLLSRGKVRDMYDLGDTLLMVSTDRISAFDVVMAEGIPDKGRILTRLTEFWLSKIGDVVPTHFITADVNEFPDACRKYADILAGRSMLVHKAAPLPVECIVRGYLSGSGWNEYRQTGAVCGIALPEGLRESSLLPEPVYTPSTKAAVGSHDENISFGEVCALVGRENAERLRDLTLAVYKKAAALAEERGIIIADTKMEFGMLGGRIILIDELLTPDSSRFWPKDDYVPGRSQASFDKQFVRDYLASLDWDKNPPPPALPADIISRTREKYIEAYERLTGAAFAA